MTPLRLAILGSTRGSNLLGLIEAISQKKLAATIELVLSDKPQAMILERARAHHIPAFFVDPSGLSREAFDEKLSEKIASYSIELIVLIGYMRILSKPFVTQWQHQIINVHPSLLPAYANAMDKAVHQAVLNDEQTETGCTVHFVTEAVDAGPILVQKKCPVFKEDTVDTLKARVQQLEVGALIDAILMVRQRG